MPDLPRPVCPMCGEPGIHPTTERCLEALRAELDRLRTLARWQIEPSVRYLDRWVVSFYDY